jgi:hypothetical protein
MVIQNSSMGVPTILWCPWGWKIIFRCSEEIERPRQKELRDSKHRSFNPSKQTGNYMNHVLQCTEILHSAHNAFVCSVSFSLYTSWSQWWSFVTDMNWTLKYSDKCFAAELKSVCCISGSLLSHTISHLTFIWFSQWSITSFPFHQQS